VQSGALNTIWPKLPKEDRLRALYALGRMVAQRLPIFRRAKEVKDEQD
jgi:hypothetical protein